MSVPDPYALALRLLARREHSSAELAAKLRRKGCAEPAVAAAVERCRELGYVDDLRFARLRARQQLETGRAFGPRLLQDLQRFGIDPETAGRAADEALAGRDETDLLADLAGRRFPAFDWHGADDRERRRVIDYFLRRGFSLRTALTFFKTREVDRVHHDDRE